MTRHSSHILTEHCTKQYNNEYYKMLPSQGTELHATPGSDRSVFDDDDNARDCMFGAVDTMEDADDNEDDINGLVAAGAGRLCPGPLLTEL